MLHRETTAMIEHKTAYERAMWLAAVSGLKTTMGPALVSVAGRRPGWQNWMLAAAGEMLLDKLPFLPSRSRLPLLLPRALAGYWTAKTFLEGEGIDDPSAAWTGAAVAAGVATFAPLVRGSLRTLLWVPDHLVGLAEDALAIYFGAQAAGLSLDQLGDSAREAIDDVVGQLGPAVDELRERLQPA
jgi:hypothetical protein